MIVRTKKVILWLPAAILVAAAIVVMLILVTNNTQRIKDLENSQQSQTITFIFAQGVQRFRVVCTSNDVSPDIYVCATIRLPNAPRPSPSPTISPGG